MNLPTKKNNNFNSYENEELNRIIVAYSTFGNVAMKKRFESDLTNELKSK